MKDLDVIELIVVLLIALAFVLLCGCSSAPKVKLSSTPISDYKTPDKPINLAGSTEIYFW